MAPNFFQILLAIVAVYAFLRGSRDERQIGVVLVVGVIATTWPYPRSTSVSAAWNRR